MAKSDSLPASLHLRRRVGAASRRVGAASARTPPAARAQSKIPPATVATDPEKAEMEVCLNNKKR